MRNTGSTVALPSHYYAILTRCLPAGHAQNVGINGVKIMHCDGELDSLAVILPHTNEAPCAVSISLYIPTWDWYELKQ